MYTLNWTTTQRHVAFASFTSWMLDAFDFFILVFVLSDLAEWFHASVSDVSIAIMLTWRYVPLARCYLAEWRKNTDVDRY